jgi:two-component sensor histidine kinase
MKINKELQVLNQDLDKKNEENRKLNMEIHHRVKNNLAVISSLLEMQERKAGDRSTRQELNAARSRIRSIADTHRFMIQDGSVKNATEYIEQLLNGFVRSFGHQPDAVSLQLETEDFSLTSRESFSVAIILNELVLNTFKHARIESAEQLRIKVSVSRNEAGSLKLRYEDNGRTPAEEEQMENSGGMGLSIINMLAEDDSRMAAHFKYDLNIFA